MWICVAISSVTDVLCEQLGIMTSEDKEFLLRVEQNTCDKIRETRMNELVESRNVESGSLVDP